MQKRINFISPEEFKQIYKAEKNIQMKICLILGFGSGLRISEIIGYKRKTKRKLNKETKIVQFLPDNTEIPPLNKEMIDFSSHQIRLNDGKGGKWRTTLLSPAFKEEMLNYLPISLPRRTIQYKFQQLTKRILGKKMSFHVLRHGFGNYQANILKTPLPLVQALMGHSRLDTTGIYTKVNPSEAIENIWKTMEKE